MEQEGQWQACFEAVFVVFFIRDKISAVLFPLPFLMPITSTVLVMSQGGDGSSRALVPALGRGFRLLGPLLFLRTPMFLIDSWELWVEKDLRECPVQLSK